MIVTIDGPAASGKSTAARALAERLGFQFMDTGAMYRTVALAALQRGVPLNEDKSLGQLAASLHISFSGRSVFLDGQDVSQAIREVEVTRASRQVADSPAVRACMVRLQREAARGGNIVTEGRDQGTVVFPDAGCKVFLTARPDVRAWRRQQELAARGQHLPIEQVQSDQTDRDQRDAERSIAPMIAAPDATVLDTTQLTFEAVVDKLEQLVRTVLSKTPLQQPGSGPADSSPNPA
jgi:cytidylate kinase